MIRHIRVDKARLWTERTIDKRLFLLLHRDGGRQGASDAGSAPANGPSMAELAAALQAAERQPQLLRQVELASVAAAELALSQVPALIVHQGVLTGMQASECTTRK